MFRRHLLFFFSIAFYVGLTANMEAQPTSPPTIGPTEEVYVENNYTDWRIAFIVAEGELADDYVVTPQKIAEYLGDEVVTEINDWDTFLELDAEKPFDALIIHKLALSFLDNEWTQDAYRRGIVMAVINIYYPELADLIFPCKSKDELPDPDDWYPEGHDFQMNFHLSFALFDKSEREAVLRQLEDCVPLKEIDISGVNFGTRITGESLEEHGDYYGFRFFFGYLVMEIERKKQVEYMESTGDFSMVGK
jgi:hypothetical protein